MPNISGFGIIEVGPWPLRQRRTRMVMPRISMFFGIVVFMYYDDHTPPHFHVLYEGQEAVYDVDANLLHGRMTARANKLVREWAELHRSELHENWELAREGQPLNWIEPLR